MNNPSDNEYQSPPHQPAAPESRWPSILQLVLSLLGALSLWVAALLFLFLSIFPSPGSNAQLVSNQASSFLWAAGLAFSGLLLLPSAGYAALKLMGKPAHRFFFFSPRFTRWGVFLLVFVAFPAVLILGYFISQGPASWFLLPVLHILGIGIPVFVLQYLGRNGLPEGSQQREWGVFAAGLVLGPALIMLLEVAAIAVLGLLVLFYVASNPALSNELILLMQRISTIPTNPERVYQLIEPYLFRPGVIFLGFVFLAAIVPLIEETLKPIGVWLLVGMKLKPVDGFSMGLLSGAGYAFFESLLLSAGGGEWAATVLARAGTSVVHIFTAGIMGWALVSFWKEQRYLRFGLAYLGMVLIHGTWNGLTLWSSLAALRFPDQASAPLWARLGFVAPAALLVIIVILFSALIYLNRRWRHAIIHQSILEAGSDLPSSQVDAASTQTSEPVNQSGIEEG
jgi:hypothetical protein